MTSKEMKHITIDYGIDLGTTNSAIGRMVEGKPLIIRSDNGMETVPSCISFKKNGVMKVGHSAYSELGRSKLRALKHNSAGLSDSVIEFKRFMGSDKTYLTSQAEHRWTPEELSAQVLKALCSFVTDEDVKAAVITVPAKFTVNQKDATLEAARLAGLEQVELLQEPIAASMAYGLTADDKKGIWMVFDFGGGTLDVALVHVCEGIIQIFDTEGDNYLGGKNLDEAIVDKILMPALLSRFVIDTADTDRMALLTDALKVMAEKLKNFLSYKEQETIYFEEDEWGEDDDGEEIEFELTVTRRELEEVMRPVLQKAVDTCKNIMVRNDIAYGRLSHLILIGGPTYIPLLRRMLREQVSEKVETGIDPMTAVARGAAIYASTIPLKMTARSGEEQEAALQLQVAYEANTVDEESYITVHCPGADPSLQVRLMRTEDGLESPAVPVGEKGALLIAELLPGRPNTFVITATVDGQDTPCSPSQITILQGTRTGNAILPYNIGIEVFNPKKEKPVFTSLTGLEKNRPIPATGKVYGLKTMDNIHPGVETMKFRIPIYQGDADAEGKTAALFEYVSDVEITGDDLASYLPAGSAVNVKIEVDRSEMMSVLCEFPESRQTVRKKLDTSKRQESKSEEQLIAMIQNSQQQLTGLSHRIDDAPELSELQQRLNMAKDALRAGGQPKQVEQHVKEVMRQIEDFEDKSKWQVCRTALQRALFSLQVEGSKHHEDPVAQRMIQTLEARVKRVMQLEDEFKATLLRHEIEEYRDALHLEENYRDCILWANEDFESIKWKNRSQARRLVDQAVKILQDCPNAPLSRIRGVTDAFYSLIQRDKQEQEDSSDYQSGYSDSVQSTQSKRPDILSM